MMERMPGIGLVTCVHRTGVAAVEATLWSVQTQSVAPAEHVLVTGDVDAATDALCERYAAQAPYAVRILRREPRGIYDALNAGIEAATAPVVGLLHGGDRFVCVRVLESVARGLAASGADILYGDVRYDTGRYYSGRRFKPGSLRNGFMFPHPSMYVRREVYERFGLYATDYRVGADFEWIVRAVLAGRAAIVYLPLCMVRMAAGGTSMSLRHRLAVTPREKLRALRANGVRVFPPRLLLRYFYL